jgi:hypothetical protein
LVRALNKDLGRLGNFYNHLATLLNTGSKTDPRGDLVVAVTGGILEHAKASVTVISQHGPHGSESVEASGGTEVTDAKGSEAEASLPEKLLVRRNPAKEDVQQPRLGYKLLSVPAVETGWVEMMNRE